MIQYVMYIDIDIGTYIDIFVCVFVKDKIQHNSEHRTYFNILLCKFSITVSLSIAWRASPRCKYGVVYLSSS